MNIYSNYVYPDKLISPINGYECRAITKQTIKKFGFTSKDELLDQYPDFPLCCDELRENRRKNHHNPNTLKSINLQNEYSISPSHCRECGMAFLYERRHNKFCDNSCAATYNNRTMTLDSRRKQKESLKLTNSKKPKAVKKKKQPDKRLCVVCYSEFLGIQAKACSTACKAKLLSSAGRKSAASRVTRSKDEIKLFTLCETEFTCVANHIIADGWDADIVIPDHKIAILWNGPWHYKEMNLKNHSLAQVKNRDKIKTSLFESLGWTVLVFEDRHYTPESAFEIIRALVI
jgi:hypothetical protein